MTEHEKLLMLRVIVAKQKEELEAKEQTIKKQNIRIEKLNIQLKNMIQALLYILKKLFGSHTKRNNRQRCTVYTC